MILVFHNNQHYIYPFLKYLEKQQVNYVNLPIQEFINSGTITDFTYSLSKSCIWEYKNQIIDFSKLTGIYNACPGLEIDYFSDYISEDQEYVLSEWSAYIAFRFNNFTNCINKPIKEKQCGLIDQLPFLIKKAKQANFNTPKYEFSTLQDIITTFSKKNKYVDLQNLYLLPSYYQKSSSLGRDSIGILEYIEGDIVILYVIGGQIFSWSQNNSSNFELLTLPSEIINSAKELMQSLQLITAEIRLIRTSSNNFFFYWFSIFPIWDAYSLPGIELAFDYLLRILLSPK